MKKAFDQTIRDLKREVNKKVLKVPTTEQKILDATSNEPWGPHGSLLVDIAIATRNYPEYQMIMAVIWKRINSTGKNWRHVYKGLTVLEYLAANGSERVIDEIREHAYQISTLSSFQYIDSSGRDQGLNVRRKSESLVSLVNDRERIQEVREKAAANKDKFNSGSTGGLYRPGSGSGYGDRYDDERYEGRYGSRDEERNGYGREGERRDSEERYGRGGYKDDDYQGRYGDENQDGSRSSEREKDRSYNEDHHSSRGSSVKAEDHPQEGRSIDRKFSEQSIGAPPSYEDAVGSKSPVSTGRDEEISSPPLPKASSPTASPSPGQTTANPSNPWADPNNKAETVDEFDPRCAQDAAVSGTSNSAEMDLLGSLSDAWAITPVSSDMPSEDPSASGPFAESSFMTTNSSTTPVNQSFEDPFGDSPFKAIPSSDDVTTQAHNFASVSSFQPPAVNTVEQVHQVAQVTNNFGSSDVSAPLTGLTYNIPEASTFQLPQNSQPMQQEPLSFHNDDILAGILPPPVAASQTPFLPAANQPMPVYNASNFAYNAPNFGPQPGYPSAETSPFAAQNQMVPISQNNGNNSLPHSAPQTPFGMVPQQTNGILGDSLPQAGSTINYPSQPTSTVTAGSLALVSQPTPKEKFEPKSAVWADTLSRGLVNFNISGAKVNPNADIGVDFANLNRKEKRMEKPTASPVTSTINMGKAMGAGSGMGRSGTSMLRPQPNHVMGPGMGMGGAPGVGIGMGMGGAPGAGMNMGGAPGVGMGMGGAPGVGMGMGGAPGVGMGMGGVPGVGMGMGGAPGVGMGMGGAPGVGMGMGGYGMMNQHPMGMGPGTGVGGNMGMGMGQGVPMQQPPNGLQPGSNMPGGYNPMMGRGGYPQNPYGTGYQ